MPADNFSKLIRAVRKVNPEAADWMKKNGRKQPSFLVPKQIRNSARIYECFLWSKTPQSYEYWCEIADQLRQQERNKHAL